MIKIMLVIALLMLLVFSIGHYLYQADKIEKVQLLKIWGIFTLVSVVSSVIIFVLVTVF